MLFTIDSYFLFRSVQMLFFVFLDVDQQNNCERSQSYRRGEEVAAMKSSLENGNKMSLFFTDLNSCR